VQGAAACATVNVWPATVAVPVRDVVAVFAAMLIATAPLPLPLAPLVTVTQGTSLAAVQAQPLREVTATVVD